MSTRLPQRRVGESGPATIGCKVKCEGSYILMYTLFSTCMAS